MLVGVNCKSWVDERGDSQQHAFRIECRTKESPELVHAELTQFIQKPILLSTEQRSVAWDFLVQLEEFAIELTHLAEETFKFEFFLSSLRGEE